MLAPTLYLTVHHNQVAKIIYQELMNHDRVIYKPPEVTRTEDKKEYNRPDVVLWGLKNIKYTINKISVPLEFACKNKQEKYVSLECQLQQLYRRYTYSVIVITVGAIGAVPKNLEKIYNVLECKGTKSKQ